MLTMSYDRSCLVGSIFPIRGNQSEAMDEIPSSKTHGMTKCRTWVLLVPIERQIHIEFIQPKEWRVCYERTWDACSCLRSELAC